MKHLLSLHKPKSKAQAMVEFALVLPILLLLIYGILEVGRLIFVYSSVVSSARSAARYGAATGLNAGGTAQRYQDCGGMRDAAQSVAFLNEVTDADITIWHDQGEGVNTVAYCAAGSATDPSLTQAMILGNNIRVRVEVVSQWTPIVPIVPLEPLEIRSVSARTILANVSIAVTSPPQSWNPTGTGVAPASDTPTATPSPTATLTPIFTFTPSHTPTPSRTPTKTATSLSCDLRHNALKTSPFGMTIYNNASISVTVSSIQIYWNPSSPAGQKLKTIYLGGALIWSSESTVSPLTVSAFIGDITIPAGSNELLQINFEKNYKDSGSEQILVTFAENGCPIVDSSNSGQLP
ncbi:MAG: pilus assembly protein [Chloroflexi bacterium]|nr:pilus assembly protein [Chloroflexota bacterium]